MIAAHYHESDPRVFESLHEHICFHCGAKRSSKYMIDNNCVWLDAPPGWVVGSVYTGNDSSRATMVTMLCQTCAGERPLRVAL